MRSVLAALLAFVLAGSTAHAQAGPDEPKPSDQQPPAAQAPAQTAAPEPAPAPEPAAAPAPAPAPAPVVAAPAPAVGEDEALPNPSKLWGWGFGAGAAAAWLVALGTGVAAMGKSNAQEGSVTSPKVYTSSDRDAGNLGQTLATTAYVFMGVGAALTIIDAVIWYECLRKPRTIKRTAAKLEWTPAGVRF
jgi:hypothetical protein